MNIMNNKQKLGIAIFTAILAAGCSDDSGSENSGNAMNAGSASGNSGDAAIDAQALIDNATTAIANRTAEIQDIEIADVFPREYIESEAGIEDLELAAATMNATEGNNVNGAILLIQEPDMESGSTDDTGDSLIDQDGATGSENDMTTPPMRLVARFSGLAAGPHGFHIHETGDCSADDASSAGGHFNPTEASHGAPGNTDSHVGDLGNISADAFGVAELDILNPRLFFSGSNSVVGKAVVIHADLDDLSTQPSGNAGEIIACGVIDRYRPDAQDISRTE